MGATQGSAGSEPPGPAGEAEQVGSLPATPLRARGCGKRQAAGGARLWLEAPLGVARPLWGLVGVVVGGWGPPSRAVQGRAKAEGLRESCVVLLWGAEVCEETVKLSILQALWHGARVS